MKPVLIQNLVRHYKNRKPTELQQTDIDHVHGGHKDRSGSIVFLILVIAVLVSLIMS